MCIRTLRVRREIFVRTTASLRPRLHALFVVTLRANDSGNIIVNALFREKRKRSGRCRKSHGECNGRTSTGVG